MIRLARWIACAIFGFGFFLAGPAFAETMEIVYPRRVSADDPRSYYELLLLELALNKAGVAYQLRPSKVAMQQNRVLQQLADNDDMSVAWVMTSKEREKYLLPIRIPIDKGLLGWRIFFVNKKNKNQIEQVQTLDQLKSFTAGQQHDWPDVQILNANGLKVHKITYYESLFTMLQDDRYDYLPRSIDEIWYEEKSHRGMDIEIEQSIVLHYPTAKYFFVNKRNTALAAALEKGLRAAIKDGSFDKLFSEYNRKSIDLANLKNRRIFELQNPFLPDETPLEQKNLWLDR